MFIDNSLPCFVLALHTNAVEYSEIRTQESCVGLKWHLERLSSGKKGSLQQAVNQLFLKLK